MIDQEKLDLVARMGETGTAERIKIPCLKLKNPLPPKIGFDQIRKKFFKVPF